MTVNEMHIAVNLGVQKIASFQADILLPQEIDFELNIAMMRFIKQRYNPTSNRQGKGFEQSQKRIDDLRNLVVTTNSLTSSNGGFLFDSLGYYIYNTSTSRIYVERATLPLDYLFLISVSAEVHYKCNSPLSTNDLVQIVTTTEHVKVSIVPPLPGYVLTGMDYYNGSSWVSILNIPLGEKILKESLFLTSTYLNGFFPTINPDLQAQGMNNNIGIQMDPPVDSNHIWIGNSSPSYLPLPEDPLTAGKIRTTWIPEGGSMSSAYYVYEVGGPVYTIVNRTAPNLDKRISHCWFTQSDDIPTIMKDPFSRTGYDYIPYSIRENLIHLYSDNTFVVPRVHIVYIRTPKPISIIDNVGCELADHTHQEIVEMAVKSILEGIESRRYQSQSMENLESE